MRPSKVAVMIVGLMALSLFHNPSMAEEMEFNGDGKNFSVILNENNTDLIVQALNLTDTTAIEGAIDDSGQLHLLWVSNTSHSSLMYSVYDTNWTVLISPTRVNPPGPAIISEIAVGMSDDGVLHAVYVDEYQQNLNYIALASYADDLDGSEGNAMDLTLIDESILASGPGYRGQPAMVVDDLGGVGVAWIDSNDPLDILYDLPQVHYAHLDTDVANNAWSFNVNQTMLTTTVTHKSDPSIALGPDYTNAVVWQDTSYSVIEFVAAIDTSGSMGTEWADMCAIFYGGWLSDGGTFQGLIPLLDQSNVTLYETLYGIGGVQQVAAATSGYCTTAYQTGGSGSQGPRSNHLGQTPTDTSGGIRKLTGAVLNNAAISLSYDGGGQGSEAWGPSSTWACLSWRDSQGREGNLADPPTAEDHRWYPNATRFVIPVSDESANDGDPEDNIDIQSVNEAHDACVLAGITPMPLWADAAIPVGSQMRDLAECPNNQPNTPSVARYCPGDTTRTTHAGGEVYAFPTGSGSTSGIQYLVDGMIAKAAGSGATEVMFQILDPYGFALSPSPAWGSTSGTKCHPNCYTTSGPRYYIHDTGPRNDAQGHSHLILANSSRMSLTEQFSMTPDISVDKDGIFHIAWIENRESMGADEYSEVNYMSMNIDVDGLTGSQIDYKSHIVVDTVPVGQSLGTDSRSVQVASDVDGIHIVWIDWGNNETSLIWHHMVPAENPPVGSHEINELFQQRITKRVATSNRSIMGAIHGNFEDATPPLVDFDFPRKTFFWLGEDCDSQAQISLCGYQEWNIDVTINPNFDVSSVSEFNPSDVRSFNFDLIPNFLANGEQELTFSVEGIPPHWIVNFQSYAYHGNETSFDLTLYTDNPLFIFLRVQALAISMGEENSTFPIFISVSHEGYVVDIVRVLFELTSPWGWDDDDADGVPDSIDSCPLGIEGWLSNPDSDHDADGCSDDMEDSDDDNDGIQDSQDRCPMGQIGYHTADNDNDGCNDLTEDQDIDNDGVMNTYDDCPATSLGHISNSNSDFDEDGCIDETEDLDDDNDQIHDLFDLCQYSLAGWLPSQAALATQDYDTDGCYDVEDEDVDNDGIMNWQDKCPRSQLGWFSNISSDWDEDGCEDFTEDNDDDDDGIQDSQDRCPNTPLMNPIIDRDGDGCEDATQDDDDDNDGHPDTSDRCPNSVVWPLISDQDVDGCDDVTEDLDLDNDGIKSQTDKCEENPQMGWVSTPESDWDRDGCDDTIEDIDDDDDQVPDSIDPCPKTPLNSADHDSDGCHDTIDEDDDNDGVKDTEDTCPQGQISWSSNHLNDIDEDGCRDLDEDSDIEKSLFDIITSLSPINFITVIGLSIVLAAMGITTINRRKSSSVEPISIFEETDLDENFD